MKDSKSSKGALKHLVTAAATVSMISPILVATPAAAEVESAQSQITLLRRLVATKAKLAISNPVLQKAVTEARSEQGTQSLTVPAHTNGHSNYHTNSA